MSDTHSQSQARPESFAQSERQALAGLLLSKGPDAPTLCGEWNTRDLATHLVVREYRPDAAVGMFVPFARKHLDNVTKQQEQRDYAELVEEYRQGPPKWNPMRLADRFVNLGENFIHHEDVRRASASGGGEPRELPEKMRTELWGLLKQISRVFIKPTDVRVVFEANDVISETTGETPARHIAGAKDGFGVVVSGDVSELLLWVYGRDEVAQVEFAESEPGAKVKIQRRPV